jgi:hypothetical protein
MEWSVLLCAQPKTALIAKTASFSNSRLHLFRIAALVKGAGIRTIKAAMRCCRSAAAKAALRTG